MGEQELTLPTAFAMQFQHGGDIVAIMAETGTVIGVSPLETGNSTLSISGKSAAVKQASWQVEQLNAAHMEEERVASRLVEAPVLEYFEFPRELMNEIVGPNGSAIVELRERCGGIMIAMQPPTCEHGSMTAVIGPGRKADANSAKEELARRVELA